MYKIKCDTCYCFDCKNTLKSGTVMAKETRLSFLISNRFIDYVLIVIVEENPDSQGYVMANGIKDHIVPGTACG